MLAKRMIDPRWQDRYRPRPIEESAVRQRVLARTGVKNVVIQRGCGVTAKHWYFAYQPPQ